MAKNFFLLKTSFISNYDFLLLLQKEKLLNWDMDYTKERGGLVIYPRGTLNWAHCSFFLRKCKVQFVSVCVVTQILSHIAQLF